MMLQEPHKCNNGGEMFSSQCAEPREGAIENCCNALGTCLEEQGWWQIPLQDAMAVP